MSETSQIERQRRKRKRAKGKFTIRIRTKYHHWQKIAVDDYGTYEEMYRKYSGSHEFWCGDQPPEYDGTSWSGYRLDSDVEPEHTKSTLKRYGKHKAWIMPGLKVNGKPVILVFNAAIYSVIHHMPSPPTPQLTIREMKPEEIEQVVDLWNRSFSDPKLKADIPGFKKNINFTLVAEVDGKIVGYQAVQIRYKEFSRILPWAMNRNAYLWSIGVAEEYRGQSIGRKLIAETLARLEADGYEEFTMTVNDGEPESVVKMYQSFGFREIRRRGPKRLFGFIVMDNFRHGGQK